MRLGVWMVAAAALALSCSKGVAEEQLWAPLAELPQLPHDGGTTFTCGAKGQPLCPTQSWMKTNLMPAARDKKLSQLVNLFLYVQKHAPPGMPAWPAYAHNGAFYAAKEDMEGVKQQCKRCHDDYLQQYRAEMRDRPF